MFTANTAWEELWNTTQKSKKLQLQTHENKKVIQLTAEMLNVQA